MFRVFNKKKIIASPPDGMSELIFCVFDEKGRVRFCFRSSQEEDSRDDYFQFLNNPEQAFDGYVLSEAKKMRKSVSVALSYGEGQRKYLYVLPYERKKGKWRYACLQVTTAAFNSSEIESPCICALAEGRVCLVLVNSQHTICSVSSRVPEAFGYMAENLEGMSLRDFFIDTDVEVLSACSPDTNQSILSCTFYCLDGSKRDVEVKKFSAADNYTLYGICDISPSYRIEEFTEVSARERRRIGQDLHDSLGQMLTGISLLSRSLANNLERSENDNSVDASQISDLADEASNQIRQISRGLMPANIVQYGLCESLRKLAKITSATCDVVCEVQIDPTVSFSDVAVEMHLYRIAQEAVNNAVRHAEASRIDITVSEVNGVQQVAVCDDGSWKEPLSDIEGIGLKTMHYRASVIGGQLKVNGCAEKGTKIICRLEEETEISIARVRES